MELTKEYLDQKFAEERKHTDEKFDDFARIVAEGFSNTVTKQAFQAFEEKVEKELSEMRFQISQLAATVKQFVDQTQKHDTEIVTLRMKYTELEERLARLEQRVS